MRLSPDNPFLVEVVDVDYEIEQKRRLDQLDFCSGCNDLFITYSRVSIDLFGLG